MSLRLLLTGASGFVAAHVLDLARHRWPGAISTTSMSSGSDADYTLDITDREAVRQVVQDCRPSHILHLAGVSAPAIAARDAVSTARVNVEGAVNLAEAAAQAAVSRFVFASTAEVYGAAFNAGVVDENTPPEPLTVYARSKLAAEYLVGDILARRVSAVVVRPTNHTGPGQDGRFVAPAFAEQVARLELSGENRLLVGNLAARRDFLDVRDVADAYLALLTADTHPEVKVVNLCSGVSRPVRSIVEVLTQASTAKFAVEKDEERMRSSDVPVAAIDGSLFRALTGWSPKIPFNQTISDLLDEKRMRLQVRTGEGL